VPRLTVDDPHDPRIAEFVGLRERPLRRGLRPADPGQRLPASGGDSGDSGDSGDRHDAPDARVEVTRGDAPPAGQPGTEAPTGRVGGRPPAPGVFVSEGDVVVARALQAGYRLRSVLVDATRRVPLPAEIPGDATVYAAAPAVLERITGLGVHRGILASFDRRPLPPASELLGSPGERGPRRVVVLERVSNPANLGVILRSARGLGIDAVLLDPTCTDPLYRRVSRVAMGEGYALACATLPRLPGGLDVVRRAGFRLVALTPDPGAMAIDALDVAPDDRVALLLGAEGPGLSPGTLAAADERAGIPMAAGVDSLNVGVAAGIAFWVLGRRRPANI
jgi:tRNA G18 (ribose-2'-O)-methylase SpoU